MTRLLCCLFTVLSVQAAGPLYRATFEHGNQGWTAVRGAATVDSGVRHETTPALRLEPAGSPDACARSAPVSLRVGKAYELTGWVRTENLEVRDLGRSPIAVGAAFTMDSMPFDVHSASLGGTQPWTRLTLGFIATRSQDRILLTLGNGGSARGKAWFANISLDEVASAGDPPSEAVRTFGPAYRYPASGWIYLHIEGQPYERGYQHGYLMSREIPEYLERCAAVLGQKPDANGWGTLRTTANALFLRGFDNEILEEMKGIADGASDGGAKWLGRRLDLVDIAVANTTVEMQTLEGAMPMTPTGLEGFRLEAPPYFDRKRDSAIDHCSAFAATGPATRDGKMVIGHVTWWPLTLAEQTNIILDIRPASGHRIIMQSYPGGIESGTDWYQNDAGMVLTETTIRQSPFNIHGSPVAFRARNAIQYGRSVDEIVQRLGTHNNGLYTNEWLVGDGKNNEIAMYELGTARTKLWRSSRHEWFGGTEGFYWGNNNAKDLSVRLEYAPDPQGTPEYLPYVPAIRDLAWQELYREHHGHIDEQFGFLSFRTAPLVSAATMDAKIVTADMATNLMLWAAMGKPNQREWEPSNWDREEYAKNDGLYPAGYRLFRGEPSDSLRSAIQERERARISVKPDEPKPADAAVVKGLYTDRLWKGWLLPATGADTWFVAGSAAYRRALESDDLEKELNIWRAAWRRVKVAEADPIDHYRFEQARGVLFLDALRRRMGDDPFLKLMRDYYSANTTKTVTSESFVRQADASFSVAVEDGPAYVTTDILNRLGSALLVYGTVAEAGSNRYAAERLQKQFLDIYESAVVIRKDFEVTGDDLRTHDVIFVGRPDTNSALAAWVPQLGLESGRAMFRINGGAHASERDALLWAASNPLDKKHMVLVVAGNDPLATVKLANAVHGWKPGEYLLVDNGKPPVSAFVKKEKK